MLGGISKALMIAADLFGTVAEEEERDV